MITVKVRSKDEDSLRKVATVLNNENFTTLVSETTPHGMYPFSAILDVNEDDYENVRDILLKGNFVVKYNLNEETIFTNRQLT